MTNVLMQLKPERKPKAPKAPTGYIIYRGPSMLDGMPIVVVAITTSDNVKTGDMVQTYILPDNDMSPVVNAKLLNDASVCGNCKHRRGLGGSCYVNLWEGVRKVADGVVRGIYPQDPKQAAFKCYDRKVRLGTYGDPMAVPFWIWFDFLEFKGHNYTGYTHQWNNPAIPAEQKEVIMQLCMASVDTEQEYLDASALGYRTFRVRTAEQPVLKGEFPCPASEEQGKRLTCAQCMACDGTGIDDAGKRRASPVIVVHGSLKNRFQGVHVWIETLSEVEIVS